MEATACLGPASPAVCSLLPGCLSEPLGSPAEGLTWAPGYPTLTCPTFMTLLLQDEKGAFNFDQETVINPETGEQVTVAWVELQGTGRGAQVEWHSPLKPASWLPLPDPELVPERGDLGQQVQHHRLQLRRVPSRERGPLSLPPPPSAGV